MSTHPDRQFTITLIEYSEDESCLYFVQSQPARPSPAFTRDWLVQLLGEAAGDAARFKANTNTRFSSAGLGERACQRSFTLICHRERLRGTRAVTEFSCSERAAAQVYSALRGTAMFDDGSAVAMPWCLARRLWIHHGDLDEARVRELLDAHTDPAADMLRDAFVTRCGLSYVDAAGWLPGEWAEPRSRLA